MEIDKRQKIKEARRKRIKKIFKPLSIKNKEDKIKENNKIREKKTENNNKMRLNKKITPYNIVIIINIILIFTSLYIIFKPNKKYTSYGVEIVQSEVRSNKEITEEEAKEIAIKQFEKLGERVKKDSLEIIKLERKDGLYYYISSEKNTMEIRIKGGKIIRINAVPVEE